MHLGGVFLPQAMDLASLQQNNKATFSCRQIMATRGFKLTFRMPVGTMLPPQAIALTWPPHSEEATYTHLQIMDARGFKVHLVLVIG